MPPPSNNDSTPFALALKKFDVILPGIKGDQMGSITSKSTMFTKQNHIPHPLRRPTGPPLQRFLPLTSKSVIAELKTFVGATNTHNLIFDEGFEDFSIKYLGGLYLLINLPDETLTRKFLVNNNLLTHFKSLNPWTDNIRITERVTWLAISGLPPKLWTPDTFHSIASSWGDVIIPEDCNPRQFNRSTGRVCILTTHLELIYSTSYVPVDNVLISIRIRETDGDIDSLFNGYYLDSSSKEDDDQSDNDMAGDNLENVNKEDEDSDPSENGDESFNKNFMSAGNIRNNNSGDVPFLEILGVRSFCCSIRGKL
ncbi:hypothetical protein Tco_0385145 [Tanacetum coccineum]